MTAEQDLLSISEAVLAISGERDLDTLLRRLVCVARDIGDARYAAIGIPDGEGGFATFLTEGMDAETIDRIGWLPRTHGMLGAMLGELKSYRTRDVQKDPRFIGWPAAHPSMHSFLGVPIVADDEVLGAFYLTDKRDGPEFTEDDRRLIEVLAAHAGIMIDNARLWERGREALVLAERAAVARELHDAMSQTLFSLALTAEAATGALDETPETTRALLGDVRQQARTVQRELRSLVADLRPATLEADGLAAALRQHVEVLQRAHRLPISLDLAVEGEGQLRPDIQREIFRIVQEALHNALRHAQARSITLRARIGDHHAVLTVNDDGVGFDPEDRHIRSTRLGLTSMRQRARSIGARLEITSEPDEGTTVTISYDGHQ